MKTFKRLYILAFTAMVTLALYFFPPATQWRIMGVAAAIIITAATLRHYHFKNYLRIAVVACISAPFLRVFGWVTTIEWLGWFLYVAIFVGVFWLVDGLFNAWRARILPKLGVAFIFLLLASIGGTVLERTLFENGRPAWDQRRGK